MEPIKKLSDDVINRIAAGEIIQRPANALKELLENSIDAKATNIQITVKNGGLKLLQIQDNGIGIRKEDFEIVCERFTTSKLREFEDLQKMSTYGFRGEALASISHIAHLTITSKTENQLCAYQGTYIDSKLQYAPKPAAGNQGTIITVEDLFYNMSVRRKSLRSPAEEYQKIADVINKYAIHNASVGFALKKSNEVNDIRTPQNSTQVENIKIIYGNGLAKELIEFSAEDEHLQFKAKGYISNVNYSPKKFQFLLFINHRLVECQSLKKAIDLVYSTYLPKQAHPFVYMSLELNPANVDVNVHPTKHEVNFLNEAPIVDCIASELEKTLLGSNHSRTFYVQAKLPQVLEIHVPELKDPDISPTKKVYAHKLVRTDAKEQKLDKFFDLAQDKSCTEAKKTRLDESLTEEEYQKLNESFLNRADNLESEIKMNVNESYVDEGKGEGGQEQEDVFTADVELLSDKIYENKSQVEEVENPRIDVPLSSAFIKKITRNETKLTSILELRKEIEGNCHRVLREIFAQHVYVGGVDPTQALVQYSTKMYLCNTKVILEELFYQLIIYNFQNFDKYTFTNKIPIYELAMICFDMPQSGWTPEDGDKSELARRVQHILTQNAPMMLDYFSLEIDDDGNICSIPILLENYFPDPKGLPMYVGRLATEVNWKREKECFRTFAQETAKYYCSVPKEVNQSKKDWKWVMQHVLYPAIKEYFIPPKKMFTDGSVLDIADLHKLYKVFERC